MNKKLQYHVQSVLIPVGHFKNMAEAQSQVHEMGYHTDLKKPHLTDNYLRFRQYDRKTGEIYRTVNLNNKGTKAIMAVPEKHDIQGLSNFNLQPRHKKMLGQDGHGILQPIYHPVHHNKIETKGQKHEQYSKPIIDKKRQNIIIQRHKAEQKQKQK